MKKQIFIAVIAKKKPPLSFSICCMSYRFLFTNLKINYKDITPPPLKSVSGY